MQYMGGKTRIAKQIAAEIDKVRKPGQLVWDAFCGGLSVSVALSKKGPVLASDACAPLINLYKAVQEGWDPPTEVSKETYMAAKLLPDTDPMKAFCGFGCSFAGKWFGGYAPNGRIGTYTRGQNKGRVVINRPHQASAKKLLLNVPAVSKFKCIDFLSSMALADIIYCDPPYGNTQTYSAVANFDRSLFISHVVELSKKATIFVSEYEFPIGQTIWERKAPGGNCLAPNAIERLYHIPKGSL